MSDEDDFIPETGTLLRATNGDVIRFEPSGLTLRLSDRVLADIALRLGIGEAAPPPAATDDIPDDALRDIDAWGVSRRGDWLHFTAHLPGAQGVRGFRRHIDGGAILGDGPGPLIGLFALGGPRAALADPGAPDFPYHVAAPADDIGAVGMAGIEPAPQTDKLEPLRERTHEALVADALLAWQMDAHRPLPVFVVRAETDNAARAGDLANGHAIANLMTAARNLRDAATRLGKRAKIQAVCLDYAWEHVTGDAAAYRDGMLAVMQAVSDGLWRLGFDTPLFVARFEAGLDVPQAEAILQGQWELIWNHGAHTLIHSAPSTMFARDRFDRPTPEARIEMAEMTAAALSAGDEWLCPRLLLAERVDARCIRVTARAAGPLRLAPGIAAAAGFAVTASGQSITLTDVTIDPDDDQAVRITCEGLDAHADLTVSYGTSGPGALRDGWSMLSRTGRELHRYALPARLPVHGGPTR